MGGLFDHEMDGLNCLEIKKSYLLVANALSF